MNGRSKLDEALEFYKSSGAYKVVELYISQREGELWSGYIWLFDGTNGKRDFETSGDSILDIICNMERIISDRR